MVKVSIIIPIYNMDKYLSECLDSVLGQTLKEKEIICINDGSTDTSLTILHKYRKINKQIVIIDQENSGVSRARNNGMKIARGEFIAFMDPDDFYPTDDCLEYLYQKAKENNVLICGGSLSYVDLATGLVASQNSSRLFEYIFNREEKWRYDDYQFHYGYTRFIYNTDLLIENSIFFPEYIRYQDPPFFVKAMLCAGEFYAVIKTVYCYRTNYKRVRFTAEVLRDVLCAIRDILVISSQNRLSILHRSMVDELWQLYYTRIQAYLLMKDKKIEKLVDNINEAMDLKLIEKTGKDKAFLNKEDMKRFSSLTYKNKLLNIFNKYEDIIIYGAGIYGKETMEYLRFEMNVKITAFAITEKAESMSAYRGVKIISINDLVSYREKALVIIGASNRLQQEIENILTKLNFKHILLLNYESEFSILPILKDLKQECRNVSVHN